MECRFLFDVNCRSLSFFFFKDLQWVLPFASFGTKGRQAKSTGWHTYLAEKEDLERRFGKQEKEKKTAKY